MYSNNGFERRYYLVTYYLGQSYYKSKTISPDFFLGRRSRVGHFRCDPQDTYVEGGIGKVKLKQIAFKIITTEYLYILVIETYNFIITCFGFELLNFFKFWRY